MDGAVPEPVAVTESILTPYPVESATGPESNTYPVESATGPTGPESNTYPVESATGPTGATGPESNTYPVESATGPTGATGATGPESDTYPVVSATGPTGATGPESDVYPLMSATGPTGPVYIATIDQLVSQQSLAIQQETADRQALTPLMNSGSYNFNPALQQWASAGFPAGYPVVSLQMNPPFPCSDGEMRTPYAYVSYLLGSDVGEATQVLTTKVLGFSFGYILSGNTLQLCVSRD